MIWSKLSATEPTPSPQRRGLLCISDASLPVPAGAQLIPLAGGDFETDGKVPPGWGIGGTIVAADDAPQGKAYCRIPDNNKGRITSPLATRGMPGQPHVLSFWLRNAAQHWAVVWLKSQERMPTNGAHYLPLPATGGQWKRVSSYFWMPAQCSTVCFQMVIQSDGPGDQFIELDDIQLRTAPEAEMSAAYDVERSLLPAYDVAPRPDDGRNLALSVAKWEGRAGIPGKPFLIWAVGSSWTNFQGDGYPLIRAIRERFPNAPPIIYKKHTGSGTPWDYARGWVRQFVIAEQPDLILTYTGGTPEGLDGLLTEVRRHTTADVIVPSLHFFRRSTLSEEEIENGAAPWEKVREVCRKHHAEFVENRRELADYLKRISAEPAALVADGVHQNDHGRTRIWDNIVRHIAKPDQFTYAPKSRERQINVVGLEATATEKITWTGAWETAGPIKRTSSERARVTIEFTGNRIDLIGRKGLQGGTASVLLDGTPADLAPAYFTTYLEPLPSAAPHPLKLGKGDVAPHAIELRRNVVPQSWTIAMTSDSGNYRIEGSATGFDGEGSLDQPFISHSGQIGIDPALWRSGRIEQKGSPVIYGNRKDDRFTFDVYRSCVGKITFRGEPSEQFYQPLAQNLVNGRHVLELVPAGDGEVSIEAFYVYQPALPDEITQRD
jgi:hypothetical protein